MVPQARPVGPAFIKHQRLVALRVWSKKTHRQSGQAFRRGQVPSAIASITDARRPAAREPSCRQRSPSGPGEGRKSSRSIQRSSRRATDFGSSTAARKSSRSARKRAASRDRHLDRTWWEKFFH